MRKLWSMTKSYGDRDLNCTSNFTTKTAYVLGFAAMTSTSVCRLYRVSTVAT